MTSRRDPDTRSASLPPSPTHWAFVEEWSPESDEAAAARARLASAGVSAPDAAQCAAMRFLAATVNAEHALVLGSSGGVVEIWIREGMAPDGTLTVIDSDAARQASTRNAQATDSAASVRVITGRPTEILPRLTDTGYDLIVVNASSPGVDHASRLLRPGGVLVLRLDDHEESSRALRDEAALLRDDPRWTTAWLTVGTGLVTAVWHGEPIPDDEGLLPE